MLARDRAGATKQIFLTKSPVLAERVQKHYQKLRFSIEAADLSATELKETTPAGQLHSQTMVHARDRRASESGLPRKFGDLRPDQFPLFITFDQVCFTTRDSKAVFLMNVVSSWTCWKPRCLSQEDV
jgi:hypothetical protein